MISKEFIKETILLSPLAVLFSPEEIDEIVEDIYKRYGQQQASEPNHATIADGEPTFCK